MAGSILGVSCDFVAGPIPSQKLRNVTWTIPGINGVGVQLLGYGDAAFRLTVTRIAAAGTVGTWKALLAACQGCQGTVVNDDAETATTAFITRVTAHAPTAASPYGIMLKIDVEGVVR